MAAPSMGIRRLLNGQLTRTERGLYLEYGTKNVHLNEAMRKPKISESFTTKLLLESLLDSSDYVDLRDLLDEYEDPVVEFSIVDRPVGWANRRMIVWEIRHY